MTVAVALCALFLVAAAVWLGRRRRAVRTWDRELEVAFDAGERKPIVRRRVL